MLMYSNGWFIVHHLLFILGFISRIHVAQTYSLSDIEGPTWPCGGPNFGWMNPSASFVQDWLHWAKASGVHFPWWDCDQNNECAEPHLVVNPIDHTCIPLDDFFKVDDGVHYWCANDCEEGETNCVHVDAFDAFDMRYRVLGPLRNYSEICDPLLYSCNRNYHHFFQDNHWRCKACVPSHSVDCGMGKHKARCARSLSDACVSCQYPPLPIIAGAGVYRYGLGSLFEDCDAYLVGFLNYETIQAQMSSNPSLWNLTMKKCAWFLTPKWETGYCSVECSDGYVPVRDDALQADPFLIPQCIACRTDCNSIPGMMPPLCQGGRIFNHEKHSHGGECISCPVELPANAHWLPNCQWSCDSKHYWDDVLQKCVACLDMVKCDNPNEYFANCNNASRGSCVYCPLLFCSQPNQFISYDSSLPHCTCQNCTNPILGKTFRSSVCISGNQSVSRDTMLQRCSTSCAPFHFISQNCTLDSDITCSSCTPAIHGKLLKSPCSVYSDAQYEECPSAFSCNGTQWFFPCPQERIPLHGLCECPDGKTFLSPDKRDRCVPIQCNQGYYLDMEGSKKCKACFHENASVAKSLYFSNPGVSGVDSCFCAPGYFMQRLHEHIRCWPCGDLDCKYSAYTRQTTCTGRSVEEPVCKCVDLPGMDLLWGAGKGCADRVCSSFFESQQKRKLELGEYEWPTDLFSFSLNQQSKTKEKSIWIHDKQFQAYFGSPTVSLNALYQVNREYAIMQFSNGSSGGFFLLRFVSENATTAVMQAALFPQDIIHDFNSNQIVTVHGITSVLIHDRPDKVADLNKNIGFLWIAYECTGYCAKDLSSSASVSFEESAKCSFLDLLSMEKQREDMANDAEYLRGCLLGICFSPALNSWGYNFRQNGLRRPILSMALGQLEREGDWNLYLGLGPLFEESQYSHNFMIALALYPLYFHSHYNPNLILHDEVAVLYEVPVHETKHKYIVDIATSVMGIYLWMCVDRNLGFQDIDSTLSVEYFGLWIERRNQHNHPQFLKEVSWNETQPPILPTSVFHEMSVAADNSHLYSSGGHKGFLFGRGLSEQEKSYHLLSLQFHTAISAETSSFFFITIDLWNRIHSRQTFDVNILPFKDRKQWILSNPLISNAESSSSAVVDINGVYYRFLALSKSFSGIEAQTNSSVHMFIMDNYLFCLPDHVSSVASNGDESCVLLPCTRKHSCGPFTVRPLGTHQCMCEQGYQYETKNYLLENGVAISSQFSGCSSCSSLSENNVYCTGGISPYSVCPIHSQTIYTKLPTSMDDCFCEPGYYKPYMNELDWTIELPTLVCLPCLKGTFCPFNGTTTAIPCHAKGFSEYSQQKDPRNCFCPSRTHSISCIPCKENEICIQWNDNRVRPAISSPFFLYAQLKGVGSIESVDSLIHLCISGLSEAQSEEWFVDHFHGKNGSALNHSLIDHLITPTSKQSYVLYVLSNGYSLEADRFAEKYRTDHNLSFNSQNLLINMFLIIKRPFIHKTQASTSTLLHACLAQMPGLFLPSDVSFIGDAYPSGNDYKVAQACPDFSEWNGLLGDKEECVCIEGYESVVGHIFSSFSTHCFPCLNGTFRSRRSTSLLCQSCEEPDREHAPYIGMSKCVCKSGYEWSDLDQRCHSVGERTKTLELLAIFQNSPPEWYQYLSPPLYAGFIVGGVCFVFIVILWVFVFLWF